MRNLSYENDLICMKIKLHAELIFSVSANFAGYKLTPSDAIEIYAPYDGTSFRPRKTTITFLSTLESAMLNEFAGIRIVSDESLGRDETPCHTSHEI